MKKLPTLFPPFSNIRDSEQARSEWRVAREATETEFSDRFTFHGFMPACLKCGVAVEHSNLHRHAEWHSSVDAS